MKRYDFEHNDLGWAQMRDDGEYIRFDDPDLATLIKAASQVRDLVDRLDPPAPPTMDEVLSACAAMAKWINLDLSRLNDDERRSIDEAESNATAILNRARRAGVIK